MESGVKYVKRNFFKPRDELDADILRQQLSMWVKHIAGQRRHGTTHKRPIKVFIQQERQALLALPEQRWELAVWREAKVHPDSHIQFARALYSVPWTLVGQTVLVRATRRWVTLYADDARVATHQRGEPGQRQTTEAHLPPHRRDLRHRSQSYWQQRAEAIDPEVGRYIKEVFDSDDVLYQLRTVQKIVTYLEQFPRRRARAASHRALFYANYSYGAIKRILTKALDRHPLLPDVALETGGLDAPRFTRDIYEILPLFKEDSDAPN